MRILLSHHGGIQDRCCTEALATALLDEGHAALVLPPRRGLSPAWLRLRAVCRDFRPDLIYERHAAGHRAIARHANRCGIPLFLAVDQPSTAIDPNGLRHATRLLPVTEVLRDAIATVLPGSPPMTVLPNAARNELLLPAPFRAAPAGSPILGLFGHAGALPVLAGLGQVAIDAADPALLPLLAAACDIALLATVEPGASPPGLFASMAAGRPIVAPDQPNLREILAHEETALLFDPADPIGMQEAVRRLAAEPELARRIGAAAAAAVERQGLTWRATARRIAALAASG